MVKNYVNGTLSCFCDDEYRKSGLNIFFQEYREDGMDQNEKELESTTNKLDAEGLEDMTPTNKICR